MKRVTINILKIVGFFGLWLLLISLCSIPALDSPSFLGSNIAIQRLWWELLPLVATLITTFVFVKLVDKNQVKIKIFSHPIKDTLIGIIFGFIWLGVTTATMYLLRAIHFEGKNSVSFIAIWVLASLLNVIMQEYLMRGYVFELLKKESNSLVATIVTTIAFTAMHGGAFEVGIVAVLNVISMSFFISLLLLYTENLLAPIIVHFIWNTIGCLVLGGVSLAEDYPSILKCTFSGNILLSGGDAKMEGSIVVLIINLLLILTTAILLRRKQKKNYTIQFVSFY